MPEPTIATNADEYRRILQRTHGALDRAKAELAVLLRQLGRRFAKAPVQDFARVFIDELVKENESVNKKAVSAYGRYIEATTEYRVKRGRRKAVKGAHEDLHTTLHDVIGLNSAIDEFAEGWAEEVKDRELIGRIKNRIDKQREMGEEHPEFR